MGASDSGDGRGCEQRMVLDTLLMSEGVPTMEVLMKINLKSQFVGLRMKFEA